MKTKTGFKYELSSIIDFQVLVWSRFLHAFIRVFRRVRSVAKNGFHSVAFHGETPMSLDTLENVKTRLNISSSADDTLLATLMDAADEWIRNHCNRILDGGSFTEDLPGGSEFVCLKNFPVDSVDSIRVDPNRAFGNDTIIPADTYVVHTDRGVIQSLAGPFYPSNRRGLVNADVRTWTAGPLVVRVMYSTPASVPLDVTAAYARLVGAWYRQAKTETAAGFVNVSQQKIGESFVIYASSPPSGIPEDVLRLLSPYRVPLV
jgi:hypothetical protein